MTSVTAFAKRQAWTLFLAALLLAGAYTPGLVYADTTDPQAGAVTIIGGQQSLLNAAAINLKNQNGEDPEWEEDAQVVSDNTSGIVARDHRGTAAGWYVTVEATDFVGQGDISSESIAASNFTAAVVNFTLSSGQAIDAIAGPAAQTTAQTAIDSPVVLVSAGSGFGMGTYTWDVDYELTIPALQLAGAYQATVTYTLYSSAVASF